MAKHGVDVVDAIGALLAPTRIKDIDDSFGYASTYCLPLGTVRDWEQGRTRPDAPALALLAVIDREPEIVRRALH